LLNICFKNRARPADVDEFLGPPKDRRNHHGSAGMPRPNAVETRISQETTDGGNERSGVDRKIEQAKTFESKCLSIRRTDPHVGGPRGLMPPKAKSGQSDEQSRAAYRLAPAQNGRNSMPDRAKDRVAANKSFRQNGPKIGMK
jgi:hypothetical protein